LTNFAFPSSLQVFVCRFKIVVGVKNPLATQCPASYISLRFHCSTQVKALPLFHLHLKMLSFIFQPGKAVAHAHQRHLTWMHLVQV